MAVAGTPDYEFTYVLDGVLSEDEIQDYVGRISKFLTDNGGEVLASDEWGMKPLAFPIRNRNNGYYVNLYFKSDPELPTKIEKNLRIDEKVLRFLVLKMDAKMKRHYHAEKEKREAAPAEAEESKA
jgi:small subunit ribosomal protein S6